MILEALLLGAAALLLLYMRSLVPKGMPPGTMGLPVIGYPMLGHSRKRHHTFVLKKKYGNICTTQWGGMLLVVLTDAALIRRVRCNPHIQKRPTVFSFNINSYFLSLGVISANGPTWATNRKFMLRHIDVMGSSLAKKEIVVSREVAIWIKHLKSMPLDKPVPIDWSINLAILNVLFQMVASVRYDLDDQELHTLCQIMNDNIVIGGGSIVMLDIFPRLHWYLPNVILNKVMKVDVLEKNRDIIFDMFIKLIEEHRKTLDRANPRDMIDHFLLEAEDLAEGPETPFADERNLQVMIHDIFMAGSETSSSALRWLVLHMAINKQIQRKIHECIDAAVPRDRLPSLDDRDKLMYLEAVIMDVMRLSSQLPLAVHQVTQQTTIQGYTIPKDTLVASSLETCHRDPNNWEKPDDLHPEHFLDSDGQLVSRREAFIPFSSGKRACPGEALARVELFLFASALFQNFEISAPPGETLEQYLVPDFGSMNLPRHFSVCLLKRN